MKTLTIEDLRSPNYTLRHKEGEEVEIKENDSGHNFYIGQKVKIIECFPYGEKTDCSHYQAMSESGEKWYISDIDLIN